MDTHDRVAGEPRGRPTRRRGQYPGARAQEVAARGTDGAAVALARRAHRLPAHAAEAVWAALYARVARDAAAGVWWTAVHDAMAYSPLARALPPPPECPALWACEARLGTYVAAWAPTQPPDAVAPILRFRSSALRRAAVWGVRRVTLPFAREVCAHAPEEAWAAAAARGVSVRAARYLRAWAIAAVRAALVAPSRHAGTRARAAAACHLLANAADAGRPVSPAAAGFLRRLARAHTADPLLRRWGDTAHAAVTRRAACDRTPYARARA